MAKKKVLVIGGAGYIGSHMVRALLREKVPVAVFDNLSTGHRSSVPKGVPFIKGDLQKPGDIRAVFKRLEVDAVMHFAAACLVEESVENPIKYYENNVMACVHLLKAMVDCRVKRFIFSSSCAVYGEPKKVPMSEAHDKAPKNPYGRSKLMMEEMLRDVSAAYDFSYIALRYFNACGAHASGQIGERHDPESHLIPNILKAASGRRKSVTVFGDDYPTRDGTCVRDYIHVDDLAQAHLLALKALKRGIKNEAFNLGIGEGYSVRQILKEAERVTGKKIKVILGPRRPGDPSALVAKPDKARKVLGWKPRRHLRDIVSSAWNWERKEAGL